MYKKFPVIQMYLLDEKFCLLGSLKQKYDFILEMILWMCGSGKFPFISEKKS